MIKLKRTIQIMQVFHVLLYANFLYQYVNLYVNLYVDLPLFPPLSPIPFNTLCHWTIWENCILFVFKVDE